MCTERSIAVQTIKSIAKGRWHDGTDRHFSWYEPLTDPAAIGRAVRYVLSNPQAVPQHHERRPPAPADRRRGRAATSTAPDEAELRADVADHGITPMFDNDTLERI